MVPIVIMMPLVGKEREALSEDEIEELKLKQETIEKIDPLAPTLNTEKDLETLASTK